MANTPIMPANVPPFNAVVRPAIVVNGPLADRSVVNIGSNVVVTLCQNNPVRNYLFVQNLSATTVALGIGASTPAVANPGASPPVAAVGIQITNLGTFVMESNFLSTNAITVTGQSGSPVVCYEG